MVQSSERAAVSGTRNRLRWLVVGVLCLTELLVLVDNTIVNVALPTIATELGANNSGLQWVVDMYTLVFAGLLLTGGYLGDRFGRRLMLLIGVVGFTAMSVLAALAVSLDQLIAARAGLGVFAALVFPATLAIVVVIFDDAKERAIAVSAWSAVAGVAIAIGPVLGGWLLEHFSWGSIFWINVPAGLVAVVLVIVLVPSSSDPDVGSFDAVGVVLSIAGVVVLVYSVIEAPHRGWSSPLTVGGCVMAVGILAAFTMWELRNRHALFDVRLLADGRFAAATLLLALGFFSLMGFVFLVTQYFQGVKEYSPLETGIRTLPFAVVMAVLAGPSMFLAAKLGSGRTAALGALIMAVGFWLTVRYEVDTPYWSVIFVAMTTMAAGLALIAGPATHIVLSQLSTGQAGAGSAVNDTSREVGGTLGVAVLGSILASVYSTEIDRGLTGLPVPAPVDAASRESVMAGVQVAKQVPEPVGTQLQDVVKGAFIEGFHASAWVAAGVSAVAAVAGWWVFERLGESRGDDSER
ncbi:MFS transporter [Nocardia asiatica]|uniref:MFS transporter n=1 Tax=Nocardia asiatica TaxID=209252 RepID=UPI003EDF4206